MSRGSGDNELGNTLSSEADIEALLQPQASLAGLTTFRIGGQAQWLVVPRSLQEIESSVRWAAQRQLPLTVVGAGSNLLVSDAGVAGLVICTRRWRQTRFDETTGQVSAAAGEPLPTLAWKAAKRGWRGLEWAVGIPGTVGGAVFMNAGAHGRCTADMLVSAQVLQQGQVTTVRPQQLEYRYRTSNLQSQPRPVLQATLQLEPGHDPAAVTADTLADLQQRRATQPYDWPSCGSVFRNPAAHSAGWLIEHSGLKGYRIGDAQVAERHANFILNRGQATAADVFELIRHVQGQVEARWSLHLRPEVRLLGEFPAGGFYER